MVAVGMLQSAISVLKSLGTKFITITINNGKEFASLEWKGAAFGTGCYFATPFHRWERGANENVKRPIRQYIQKKTDFDTATEEYVQFEEDELNNRPWKRYNY